MANEYAVNQTDLTSVADAIREKGGTSEQLVFPSGFVTAIQEIEGGSAIPPIPSFTYSVEDGYEIVTDEETGAWKIRFLESGVLVFTSEPPLVDIWMCGAGGGSSGAPSGGGGGYVSGKLKYQLVMGEEYTITIGAGGKAGTSTGNGGTGGATSAFDLKANGGSGGTYSSGKGGNGGTGGNAEGSSADRAIDGANGASSSSYSGGTGHGMTTREFFEAGGMLYCSGGASKTTDAPGDNTGHGGSKSSAGSSGIVILRGSAV